MKTLKLEFNNNFIIIEQSSKTLKYKIDSVEKWLFLTKFEKAKMVLILPSKNLETIVDK